MNLTKGKISKLYRKTKQTLKRYKKMKRANNRSFRKTNHVNLKNRTLKGGAEPDLEKTENKGFFSRLKDSASEKAAKLKSNISEKTAKLKASASESFKKVSPFSKKTEPVAEEPVTEEPVTEQPVAEEPVAEQPVAEEPVAEEPVTEESVTEQPVAESTPEVKKSWFSNLKDSAKEKAAKLKASVSSFSGKNVEPKNVPVMKPVEKDEADNTSVSNLYQNNYKTSSSVETFNKKGLPEEVSIAVKTIIDYAIGIKNENNSVQEEPEPPVQQEEETPHENQSTEFANMTKTFAQARGGRSRRRRHRKWHKQTLRQ